jgi:peptide/nickel transport system permease protein
MATGDETFEDVDWDELSGLGLSFREKAMVAFALVYVAALVLNFVIRPSDEPMIALGGFTYDPRAITWLFVLTIGIGVFYGAWPLYNNPRLTRYYWRRFRRNKVAVASGAFLSVVFVVGLVGPFLFETPTLEVTNGYQPPVYTTVDANKPIQCAGEVTTIDGKRMCQGSWAHPLGTTSEGEDILKLIIIGMRISMQIALVTAMLVMTLGSLVGTTAAYYGGWVDEILMRYVDFQGTLPTFFIFLILAFLFEPSLILLVVLFGTFGWEGTARLVRSEALQRTEEEYVSAAESAGASDSYIIRRHILPNVSNSIITNATLIIPGFLILEAGLSFLGLTDPSVQSWGKIIADGRGDLSQAWWIATIPGVFLFFTVLAFNFLGDALRDALDPRTEGTNE